jgi:hypothetical protein
MPAWGAVKSTWGRKFLNMFGIRASPLYPINIFLLEKRRDLMSTPFKMGNKFCLVRKRCKIPLNLKK